MFLRIIVVGQSADMFILVTWSVLGLRGLIWALSADMFMLMTWSVSGLRGSGELLIWGTVS